MTTYKSFGVSTPVVDYGYLKSMWITKTKKDDNTPNQFDNVAAVTKSAVNALIEAANTAPDTALFPLGFDFDNLSDERAETVFESLDSGAQIKIRKGKRTLTAIVPRVTFQLIEQINEWNDQEISIYPINDKDELLYETDRMGVLVKPWKVQKGSLAAKEVPGTASTSAKVELTLTFDDTFYEDKVKVLEPEDFNPSSCVDVPALIETEAEIQSGSTTQIVVDIATSDGAPVTGLVQGDFSIQNLTDDAAVAITGFAEDLVNLGRYTLTYAIEDAGDVLSPRINKAGYFYYYSNQEEVVITA